MPSAGTLNFSMSSNEIGVGVNYFKDTKKSESKTELVELKKEVGLWNGIGIIVGSMIGSGIFVSPGSVVRYTGSIGMSLIVWVLTGVMAMCGALCYLELGTMIPKSGGEYTYILEAFGPIPAFLDIWYLVIIGIPASRAISLLTFSNYILQPFFQDCGTPPYWAVRLLAVALLWFIGYINCVGVKMGTRLQNTLTFAKLMALVIIIVIGVLHLAQGNTENFINPMEGTISDPASIATAFYSTSFAYAGWDSLNNMTEEIRNPNKNLPRVIMISLVLVTCIYILTNVAYFAVLTPSDILSSSAVAVTFGDRMMGFLAWLISIFVACSVFGSLNGGIITLSRVFYAGARVGHLPKFIGLIHIKNKTPVLAIVASLIGSSFIVFMDDIGSILTYLSFAANILNLLCMTAFLWFRYKEPERHRPIKVWIGFPIVYFVINIFVTLFPVIQQPVEITSAMGVLGTGLLVYYFAIHRKNEFLGRCMDKLHYLCQLTFECVEEEKSQ